MPTPGQLTKKVAHTLGLEDASVANAWRVLREHGLVTKGGRGRSAATVTDRDAAILITAICGCDTVKGAADLIARAASGTAFSHYYRGWDSEPVGSERDLYETSPIWKMDRMGISQVCNLPGSHSFVDLLQGMIGFMGGARYSTDPTDEAEKKPVLQVERLDFIFSFESPNEIFSLTIKGKSVDGELYYEAQKYGGRSIQYDLRNVTDEGRSEMRDRHSSSKNVLLRTGDLNTVRSFGNTTIAEIGRFVAGVDQ
ncbi:hypothetical protein SAMN04488077_101313 [Roseovarius tolerans]|jgi:hypothetical protein|uniref:Uncharacterized protein n=1 Tax=Roseovarius tolerans TaxID=74031 RepID=A0A1H7UZZ4_9RHOB|nr:hypothetical protein [Roseovarius tolerans]SEM02067.1 hypothetical protein SAMN04488077_101313 [Roseovarius tolerans]